MASARGLTLTSSGWNCILNDGCFDGLPAWNDPRGLAQRLARGLVHPLEPGLLARVVETLNAKAFALGTTGLRGLKRGLCVPCLAVDTGTGGFLEVTFGYAGTKYSLLGDLGNVWYSLLGDLGNEFTLHMASWLLDLGNVA